MENKSHALAAGAFVLVVTALLIALAMWLMRDVANTDAYELSTEDPVSGLQVQAPVRFKGVAVGKVTGIAFDPKARGNVLVTIAVDHDAPVTKSTFATLAYQGVTGLSFVQLDDSGQSREPIPPPPEGGLPRIPLQPSLLGQLSDRAQELVSKLGSSAERINEILGPGNQAALTALLKDAGAAAKSVQQLAANTDKTIQAQIGPGNANIPLLVRQTTSAVKTVQEAAAATRQTVGNLNGVAVDLKHGMASLTGPGGVVDKLSESANTVTTNTLPRIQVLTEDASHTIRRLDRIANSLSENPQALLYGGGALPPGPGEPGFVPPAGPSKP